MISLLLRTVIQGRFSSYRRWQRWYMYCSRYKNLADQNILLIFTKNNTNDTARRVTVEKLTDQIILAEFAKNYPVHRVR